MDEHIDQVLTAWNKRPEGAQASLITVHPSEGDFEGYLIAVATGRIGAQLTGVQQATRAHILTCEDCQAFVTSQQLRYSEVLVQVETQKLAQISTDAFQLVEVLTDLSRPGWVRAIACDYLGLCGGGRAVSEALYATKSDADAEVREAAEEAQAQLQGILDRFMEILSQGAWATQMRLTHRFTEAVVDLSPFASLSGSVAPKMFLESAIPSASITTQGGRGKEDLTRRQHATKDPWIIRGRTADGFRYALSLHEDELVLLVMAEETFPHQAEVNILIIALGTDGQDDVLICDKQFTLVPLDNGFGFIEHLGVRLPLMEHTRLGLFVQHPACAVAPCQTSMTSVY